MKKSCITYPWLQLLIFLSLSPSYHHIFTQISPQRVLSQMPLALVSCNCCNKLPQTRWIKTIKICSVTILEAQKSSVTRPKSRFGRVTLLLESLGTIQALLLQPSGGCQHSLVCSHKHPIFKIFPVSTSHSFLLAFTWIF